MHLASLLCQYGYLFPVTDTKSLQVRDDGSLYRFQVSLGGFAKNTDEFINLVILFFFQTPAFWPSYNTKPDDVYYGIQSS